MHLRQTHLFGGASYIGVVPTGSFLGSASFWSGSTPIQLKVANPTFVNTVNPSFSFQANNIFIQINDIGGNVPGSSGFQGTPSPPAALSTSPATLFQPRTSLFDNRPTGVVNMRYSIANAAIISATWRQGEYRNIREYTTYTSGSLRYFTPVSERILLEVDAILNWIQMPVASTVNLPASIFDLYRSETGLNVVYEGILGTTLPYRFYVRANSSAILHNEVPASPSIPLSVIRASGRDRSLNQTFNTLSISTNTQELTLGTEINIATQNRNNITYTMNISRANLLQYFFRPGTYRLPPVMLTTNGTAVATTYNEPGGLKTVNYELSPFQWTIPAQQQILLTDASDLLFDFNSLDHFADGNEQTLVRNLRLSSNIDYTLYVRSEGQGFLGPSGELIPLNVLEIGSATGDPNVRNVILTNQSQTLVSPSGPSLDRTVALRYVIPAVKARASIFGKPSGTYRTSIIYSFIAN